MVCPRIKNAILAKKLSNARPLPFSRGGKRKQNRRRGSPGPQVILSVLFSGEPPHRYHKNRRYNKGLRPRVFGPLYCFSPAPNRPPGAPGPLIVWAGSGGGVRVDFHRENPGPAPERHSKPAGIGAGHPPLWCPTMALKIKIPGGSGGFAT